MTTEDADDAIPSPTDGTTAADHCPPGAAVQDHYPDEYAQCYGCGRLNETGLHIRSCWDDGETVAYFTPRPEHRALPGIVYGGLIASLVDCHSTGTAAAAIYRSEGRGFESLPHVRCVTAALHVDYLRPTPLAATLEIRGRIKELKGKKVVVTTTVSAGGEVCARGEVVAIRVLPGSEFAAQID
jgi:acyl-coenzyme A thioesterase PaaI-like protein